MRKVFVLVFWGVGIHTDWNFVTGTDGRTHTPFCYLFFFLVDFVPCLILFSHPHRAVVIEKGGRSLGYIIPLSWERKGGFHLNWGGLVSGHSEGAGIRCSHMHFLGVFFDKN